MCATFCPTGAIAKYAGEDGSIGVTHRPVDCVKCRCCTGHLPGRRARAVRRSVRRRSAVGAQERYPMKPLKNPPGKPAPDLALHEGSAQLRPGVRALGAGALGWRTGREGVPFRQNVSRETPAVKERMFHVKHPDSTLPTYPGLEAPSSAICLSRPFLQTTERPRRRLRGRRGNQRLLLAFCDPYAGREELWASSAAAKKSRKRSSFLGW